jgi:hypothetical protein
MRISACAIIGEPQYKRKILMANTSLIYRNIYLYRLIMNLLYKGSYNQRFKKICRLIEAESVVELCFGDTNIAEYCRQKGIDWTGFDMNAQFVSYARKKGFDARLADVKQLKEFPPSDLCIISGSMYHFVDDIDSLILKMMKSAKQIIISEPIQNLSNRNDLIGYLAKRSANCGEKQESFRFTQSTFEDMLFRLSVKCCFKFRLIGTIKKDIIAVLHFDPIEGHYIDPKCPTASVI